MPKGRAIAVRMVVSLVGTSHSGPLLYRCLKCGGELDLHQPDIEMPERLLATCSERCQECGSWHLVDRSDRASRSFLVLLPSAEELATAYEAS